MNVIKKISRAIARPFYRAILNPSFRYSQSFEVINNSFNRIDLEFAMERAVKFVRYGRIEGDYFEFGTAGGGSLTTAYHLSRTYIPWSIKFYSFDSFEGLPEITGIDAQGFKHFEEKGEFACSLERVRAHLKKNKVDLSAITFTKGWYNKTLDEETKKRIPATKASFVLIDVDLYESTVPVLDFITSYIQTGTVLIFDDYFCYRGDPNRGERRAVREWLERNPQIELTEFYHFSWGGNSFIVHVNEKK